MVEISVMQSIILLLSVPVDHGHKQIDNEQFPSLLPSNKHSSDTPVFAGIKADQICSPSIEFTNFN